MLPIAFIGYLSCYDFSASRHFPTKNIDDIGKSMKEYLCEFHWDSERFPEKNAIGEHKNLIQQVRGGRSD